MNRHTQEQITEAREWFVGDGKRTLAHLAANYPESYGAIMTLLAATAPPTDEEIVEFAVGYYVKHNIGSASIRTTKHIGAYMHDMPESRAAAMAAAVRHFLGQVKP